MLPTLETCLKMALLVDWNGLMNTLTFTTLSLELTISGISATFFAKDLSTFLLSLSFCLI